MKTNASLAALLLFAQLLTAWEPSAKRPNYWAGMWKGSDGHRFRFAMELQTQRTNVTGRILWKLVEAPPFSPLKGRVGETGYEFLQGTYASEDRSFHLRGTRVTNDLLSKDEYKLTVSADGKDIEGVSKGNGTPWESKMVGDRAEPPAPEKSESLSKREDSGPSQSSKRTATPLFDDADLTPLGRAIFGGVRVVPRQGRVCPNCNGSGKAHFVTGKCWTCGGSGRVD